WNPLRAARFEHQKESKLPRLRKNRQSQFRQEECKRQAERRQAAAYEVQSQPAPRAECQVPASNAAPDHSKEASPPLWAPSRIHLLRTPKTILLWTAARWCFLPNFAQVRAALVLRFAVELLLAV